MNNKDFSKAVRTSLKNKGIMIITTTWLPGTDGSYANGERGYVLNDNGTERLRTYMQVKALAA